MIPNNSNVRNRETWKNLPPEFLEMTEEAQEARNVTFILQENTLHEAVSLYNTIAIDDIKDEEDKQFLRDIFPGAKGCLVIGRPIADPWYRLEQLVPGVSMQRTTCVSEGKVELHLRRFLDKIEVMGYHGEIAQQPITPDPRWAHFLENTQQGFAAKNGYFISKVYGCRTNFGLVVTDAPLMGGDLRYEPWHGEGCGDCHLCQDLCPAHALTEQGYDKEKCLAYRNGEGNYLKPSQYSWFKCDMCMRCCPQGEKGQWDKEQTTWDTILKTGEINY